MEQRIFFPIVANFTIVQFDKRKAIAKAPFNTTAPTKNNAIVMENPKLCCKSNTQCSKSRYEKKLQALLRKGLHWERIPVS